MASAQTSSPDADRVARARDAVASNQTWYHTLELAPGVVTPGHIDLRGIAAKVLPDDLSGLRAVDVGTFDGFWAFEMERRGAEVVATDVEQLDAAQWPPRNRAQNTKESADFGAQTGKGFRIAREVLGSRAEWVACDVYDLSPEVVGGPVDVIFMGDLLLHLRDPIRALERIYDTLRPGGRHFGFEPFSVRDTLLAPRRPMGFFKPARSKFTWWHPNYNAVMTMPFVAGFDETRRLAFVRPPARDPRMRQWHVARVSQRASS